MDLEHEEVVQLRLLWKGIEDAPLLYVNQFVLQHEQDELILTVGQLQPPILLGQPAEVIEQAKSLTYVPVNVVTRLAFTRQRLGELSRVINEQLEKFDRAHGKEAE